MRIRQVVLAILLFVFFCPISASATVYYTGPQTVYVRPDPYYQTGQAISNILSAMIESSRQNAQAQKEAKQQQEWQQLMAALRQRLREIAKNEAETVAKCAGEIGIAPSIKGLMTLVSKDGLYAEASSSNGTDYLYWEKQVKGLPKIEYRYALDREYGQCRVSVSIPEWNLEERQSSMFVEPRAQTDTRTASEFLGLNTSPEIIGKNGHFGLAVTDVVKGGIADSAGILPGDMITQIDTYPLRDRSIEQIISYITNRVSQKARISVKLVRQGKVNYANIQF